MNNLKCLKQGFNKYICKYYNKEIKLSQCINCPYKEYKTKNIKNSFYKVANSQLKNNKMQNSKKISLKQRTNKLNKLEKNRFSLFTDDNTQCMLCGSTYQLTWNEVFRGTNRQLSMKYGLCQRLCLECHRKYQDDPNFNNKWHRKGQEVFNKEYPNLDFINIFGRNYLDK